VNDKSGERLDPREEHVVRMPSQPWGKNGLNPTELLALGSNGMRYNGK
jgi:hypothetical protein